MWSQAGGSAEYRPVGYWWAATPELPGDEEAIRAIRADWQEPYGDRRQQLVYIGQNLPKEAMQDALRKCLLNDREMASGTDEWKERLRDPFPKWLDTGSQLI